MKSALQGGPLKRNFQAVFVESVQVLRCEGLFVPPKKKKKKKIPHGFVGDDSCRRENTSVRWPCSCDEIK